MPVVVAPLAVEHFFRVEHGVLCRFHPGANAATVPQPMPLSQPLHLSQGAVNLGYGAADIYPRRGGESLGGGVVRRGGRGRRQVCLPKVGGLGAGRGGGRHKERATRDVGKRAAAFNAPPMALLTPNVWVIPPTSEAV